MDLAIPSAIVGAVYAPYPVHAREVLSTLDLLIESERKRGGIAGIPFSSRPSSRPTLLADLEQFYALIENPLISSAYAILSPPVVRADSGEGHLLMQYFAFSASSAFQYDELLGVLELPDLSETAFAKTLLFHERIAEEQAYRQFVDAPVRLIGAVASLEK